MSSSFAFTGTDGQLYLGETDGSAPRQLTLDLARNPLLLWGRPELKPNTWTWPCWSPDHQRLACFELPDGEDLSRPAKVHVLHIDGVSQIELCELSGRVPIYSFWSPDGAGLAVLAQDEEQLVLGYSRLDEPGNMRVIEEGTPLFCTWAPDGRHLLVHSGVADLEGSARLIRRDALGRLPDEPLPHPPGNFCAPVVVGDSLVHVDRTTEVNRLLVSDLHGESSRVLLEFSGLGAIAPVPGRDEVVFSTAPAGQGSPYRGATLINVRNGDTKRLCEDNCLAFFWSVGGQQLVYARVDTEDNCLAWHTVRPGEQPTEVTRFWPSREMLFFLHFFDQFIQSHSLVSPDGRHLVFAGNAVKQPRVASEPQVLLLDLTRTAADPGQALRTVAPGGFACFPASPVPR